MPKKIGTINRKSTDIADSIGVYMKEMGGYPLLKPEEEIELSHAWGRWLRIKMILDDVDLEKLSTAQAAVLDRYDDDPRSMSRQELTKIRRKGEWARNKMIKANLRLVIKISKSYTGKGLEMMDLVQEGNIGLMTAVNMFDPTKGWKFSTYAYWWIRQAMTRALSNQSRAIRLPVHIVDKVGKARKIRIELTRSTGKVPTWFEVAKVIHPTYTDRRLHEVVATLEHAIGISDATVSLDARVANDSKEKSAVIDFIPDPSSSPEDVLWKLSRVEAIDRLLRCVGYQQKQVLTLVYGLDGSGKRSLGEAGKIMGVSRERVRQVKMAALRVLEVKAPSILGIESLDDITEFFD